MSAFSNERIKVYSRLRRHLINKVDDSCYLSLNEIRGAGCVTPGSCATKTNINRAIILAAQIILKNKKESK